VIDINIQNDYNSNLSYRENYIKDLIIDIINSKEIANTNLTVVLTNREYLSNLKKKYFNLEQFTDVIAFNLSDDKNDCLEGEIYISIDDVIENSKIYKQTFEKEFKRIIIHGTLHLLGYEDTKNTERQIMRDLEEKYLSSFTKSIIYKWE